MKLIAAGDNVVDYYQDQETFYPGGNALNVAVLARRLGHETSYIGILGSDEAADHVLNVLKLEKVNADLIRRAYGENGMAVVTLDERGDRIFAGKYPVPSFIKRDDRHPVFSVCPADQIGIHLFQFQHIQYVIRRFITAENPDIRSFVA